uniref:Uncharacterized protein n=1 Tax=Panagrolaimus sp. PS1159 TaxID=55785 RepID=A0AC35F4X2_9BILA
MSTKPFNQLLETVGNSSKLKNDKESAIIIIPKLISNILPPVFYSAKNDEINELGDRLRYYENHIFNFYGKDSHDKAKAAANIFCSTLFDSLLEALKKCPQNISNKKFFWKIILTLTNSTLDIFISDFTVFMVENSEKAEIWQSMMASDGLEFTQYENFIVKIMNVAKKPSDLIIIFGENVCTNLKLSKFLTETVLVRRIQSPSSIKRHSYLIAGYLSVVSRLQIYECRKIG